MPPRPPPRRPDRSERPAKERVAWLSRASRLEASFVLQIICLFCLAHWALRVLIAPVATVEEAEQILLSQSLQGGYAGDKPPLTAWLISVTSSWWGRTAEAAVALKYVFLFIALSFYYLAARIIIVRPGAAAAAAGALTLTYGLGWGVHEDMLGLAALTACLSLTLHALARVLTWRRQGDWIYLGLVTGVGLLAHPLYAILPVACIASVLSVAFFRQGISLINFVLAVVTAGAVASPFLIWLAAQPGAGQSGDGFAMTLSSSILLEAFPASLGAEDLRSWWETRLVSLSSLGRAALSFSLPFSLLWSILFWPLWAPVLYPVFARRSTDEETHDVAWRSVLGRALLLSGLLYLLAVFGGVSSFKTAWTAPALFLLPMWLFVHVKRAGEFPIPMRGFAALLILIAIGVFAGRLAERPLEIRTCPDEKCRPYAPVAAWAAQLREVGFEGGTLVGSDIHLMGNLRAELPEARVLDAGAPSGALPPATSQGACLVVWRNSGTLPEDLAAFLTETLEVRIDDPAPDGAIVRTLLESSRMASLYYKFVSPSPACR